MEKTEMMKRYEEETGKRAFAYIMVHIAVDGYDYRGLVPSEEYTNWLEAQLRWRPVSEKPDKGQMVLYFGETVDIGEYDGYEEWIDTDGGICPVELTSHWFPIPPTPEEVK
jgi:hypothetical protein